MRYRAAIVGCGAVADAHARMYAQVESVDLVAVCDVRPEAARALAERWGVPSQYTDYRELVSRERPDLVSVCTWPQFRSAICCELCRSGVRAVYAEKPMCMDLREAKEMVQTAEATGTFVVVGHQRRMAGPWRAAKRLLDEGAIGRLVQVETFCEGWDIFEWGTHWVDIARFYNDDSPVAWVLAQVSREWDRIRYGHRLDTEAVCAIGFANGVRALLLTGDHVAVGAGFHNRLVGTDGIIEVDWGGTPVRVWTHRGLQTPAVDPGDPMAVALQRLLASLETGAPHPMHVASAYHDMEVLMAIYESARSGRLVRLPLEDVLASPWEAMLERCGVPWVVPEQYGV